MGILDQQTQRRSQLLMTLRLKMILDGCRKSSPSSPAQSVFGVEQYANLPGVFGRLCVLFSWDLGFEG